MNKINNYITRAGNVIKKCGSRVSDCILNLGWFHQLLIISLLKFPSPVDRSINNKQNPINFTLYYRKNCFNNLNKNLSRNIKLETRRVYF